MIVPSREGHVNGITAGPHSTTWQLNSSLPILSLSNKIILMTDNWDLLGHEWAVNLLREHLAQGRLRHAYLITGPEGVGRRTLALRMAQTINCPDRSPSSGEPCLACRSCQQFERMQHPDLAVVRAEHSGGTLKVDQVRELQRSLSLAPYEARYRVAVLLRFESANPSAANALLKTLEEPPPQVILIVTAESAERLLPTIVSRCEVLRLRPLPLEMVSQGLQARWGLEPETGRLLAHLSGGRPGYALRLHQEPERMEQRRAWLDDLQRLLTVGRVERFAYVEPLSKEKEALRGVIRVWLSFWRDVLLCASGASAPLANLDREEQVQNLAARFGLKRAHAAISSLERTLDLVDRNVNPRLAVEILMLDLPYQS
jgi:DNA polymerase-3 subunit delta'